VYVSNPNDGSVTVINSSTDTIVAKIPLCGACTSQPAGLAVTPGGKFVYVADQNQGVVWVIDTSNNTVSTSVSLTPIGCEFCTTTPIGVAITPDGSRVYVTDTAQGAIDVIDTSTNTLTTSILTVGTNPTAIAITSDGSAAYYTFGTNSVGRIDTNPASLTYNTKTATITVGSNATGVAITPDSTFIYVTNHDDNTVSVISNTPPTFTPVTTVSLGTGASPFSVAITPDGKTAYIASEGGSASVFVIDTATKTAGAPVAGNCAPQSQLAITSDSSKVYVADEECSSIDVFTTGNSPSLSTSISNEFPANSGATSPFGVAIAASQTKTLGGPGTTTIFTFNSDTYKITPITNQGGEIITVEAFLINASNFPAIPGFTNEKCIPYGDYSSGGVDTCVEFQVHCQNSANDLHACNFIYLVATGYDLPADLSGGIGGPDFLVAHGVDCALTNTSVVQSIFLSYDATIKDPTTRGGSRGPSCFVATYTPGAPVISGGSTSRFAGWGSPVLDGALNQVKAGSTRPLSFQFFDVLGNPVGNLSLCNSFKAVGGANVCLDSPAVPTPWVNFASYGIPCPNSASINPSTDSTLDAAGGSGLQKLSGGSYQFNWKTLKSWKGACANVVVTFDSTLTVVPATLGFQFN
jgi:YVTN family beta-propeller protein